MAKKRKMAEPARELTKHQLARWQRQRRWQRIFIIIGLFVIFAVLALLGVGWYVAQYRPLHETVIRVNDTEFNMKYYLDRLKIVSQNQPPEYVEYFASAVVIDIERTELMRQEALKLGISVTGEEVEKEVERSGTPMDDAQKDVVRGQLLTRKLVDEYFDSRVPMFADQAHIMAVMLEGLGQATEVRARLVNSEDFTTLAGELSLNELTKSKKGDLGWHSKDVLVESLGTSVPAEYAFSAQAGELSQPLYDAEIEKKLGYWLIKVSERPEGEEARVHAILLGSKEESRDIRARLEAGEDFATLAKQYSRLEGATDNGGDLGLVSKDGMTPATEAFIFDAKTQIGTVSEPIRDETIATKGGYWLVKVLEKENDRNIEAGDRNILKSKVLNEWVDSLWNDSNNTIDDSYLTDDKKAWAVSQVTKTRSAQR